MKPEHRRSRAREARLAGLCALLKLTPAIGVLLSLFFATRTGAFPPAPHHLIYGLVRDELGNPLQLGNAEVIFETPSGDPISARIAATGEPAQNYQLTVPMDSGITSDAYMPTAMRPTVPFKIRVRIGESIFLPIEMTGDYSALGQPGKKTRINLTLGVDSDGDGLPDAWERALIAAAGKGQTLEDIKPRDDSDGDGLNNLDEYVAGTYAFDSKDGFSLAIKGSNGTAAVLEFMVIRGRTYTIQSSSSLHGWMTVPFRLKSGGSDASAASSYTATDVRVLQVEVEPGLEPSRFFKLMIE